MVLKLHLNFSKYGSNNSKQTALPIRFAIKIKLTLAVLLYIEFNKVGMSFPLAINSGINFKNTKFIITITPTLINLMMAYLTGLFEALKYANGITAMVSKANIPIRSFNWIGLFKSKIFEKKSKKENPIIVKIRAETNTLIKAVDINESFFSSDYKI